MIFGHLLTGSNYDDEEAKTTGGRNGYGAKLCNVFSTEFTLETQDSNTGKRYKQTWTDNMSKMGKAKISTSKSSDFTESHSLLTTPVQDGLELTMISRPLSSAVFMIWQVPSKASKYRSMVFHQVDFKKYIEMYAKAINKERGADESPRDLLLQQSSLMTRKHTEKWEIGFAVSDGSFQQVSFVNSIATTSGGTHVNYIADQICDKLVEVVKKKNS